MNVYEADKKQLRKLADLFNELAEKGTWFEVADRRGIWCKVINAYPTINNDLSRWRVAEPKPEPMDKLIDDLLRWFVKTPNANAAYEEIKAILEKHNVTIGKGDCAEELREERASYEAQLSRYKIAINNIFNECIGEDNER